jgi:acetoacetyl-CoA reductase
MNRSTRTAIVTGAARGIGAAVARRLSRDGMAVAVLDLDESACKPVVEAIESAGGAALAVGVDVADEQAVPAAVARVAVELGAPTVLVNNAGITRDTVFHRMTPEQWSAVINTNLSSLFNMCRPVIEGMRSRKFGRIINISSINGQKGQFGQTNYSAAKAGELGFTKALAQESARSGITVNAVCPGYIATDMVKAMPKDVLEKNVLPLIPIGRLGEPEEIARCVVFLASDDAGLITGSTLTANGGQYFT